METNETFKNVNHQALIVKGANAGNMLDDIVQKANNTSPHPSNVRYARSLSIHYSRYQHFLIDIFINTRSFNTRKIDPPNLFPTCLNIYVADYGAK